MRRIQTRVDRKVIGLSLTKCCGCPQSSDFCVLVTDHEDRVAVDPKKNIWDIVESMDSDGPLRIHGQRWDKLLFRFVPVSLTAGSVSN
jgi:hypothetical protein